METTYAVISKEVPARGRRFPNKIRFVEWCSSLAHREVNDMPPREFYAYVVELIAAGRLDVYQRRGQVWVKVMDR